MLSNSPIQLAITASNNLQLCAIICAALVNLLVDKGITRTTDHVGWGVLSRIVKLHVTLQPFFIMASSFAKIAIAILLLRKEQRRSRRTWFWYLLLVGQTLSVLVAVLLDLSQCLNINTIPNTGISGMCFERTALINYETFIGCKAHLAVENPSNKTWLISCQSLLCYN